MMWYEIPGLPGYRINTCREIMSLQGEWPIVLSAREKVRLVKDGRLRTFHTQALWELVSVGKPLQAPTHHEASRDRCDQGHLFTSENTSHRKSRNGNVIRKCKRCQADAMKRWRDKKARPPADQDHS